MILSTALLVLPLLVGAVPTSRSDGLTLQNNGESIDTIIPQVGNDAKGAQPQTETEVLPWSIDLDEWRLVQLADDEKPVWMTELDKIQAKAAGRRFMDITETPTLGFSGYMLPTSASVRYDYHLPGNHTKTLRKLVEKLDMDRMKAFLTHFSNYRTRYYKSDTGKQSQAWLLSQLHEIAASHPGMDVQEFPHAWGQNSMIVSFAPAEADMFDAPVTIIGAHQDSTNLWPFLPAPGADDDGSGTTSSIEALRVLAAANYTPSTPVEFHYFSAEEGGLLGSQAVAQCYEQQGRKVKAMLQMDMTAWVKKGTEECVGVIQDFVDPDLTAFVEALVTEYLSIPPVKTQCGYSCSDHASFKKAGYQSAFVIEATFENSNTRNIHTLTDTIDHPEFSFKHMREFSKLSMAFAVELAGVVEK